MNCSVYKINSDLQILMEFVISTHVQCMYLYGDFLKVPILYHCAFFHFPIVFFLYFHRGEEVVQLIANLVCQLKGSEACVAINKVIDTHARVENYLKTQGMMDSPPVYVLYM